MLIESIPTIMRKARLFHGLLVLFFGLLVAAANCCANDPGPLRLDREVSDSKIIVVLQVGVGAKGPFSKVESVLKGKLPKESTPVPRIDSFVDQEGKPRRIASFGDAEAELDDQGRGKMILFLRDGGIHQGQTGFVFRGGLPVDQLPTVRQVMAMLQDPAPFVGSSDYAGNLDLIRVLARQFFCLRLSSPEIPALQNFSALSYVDPHSEMPWQRTKFWVTFSYDRMRANRLKFLDIRGEGPLPDFVRRVAAEMPGAADELLSEADKRMKMPAKFTVEVDTTGDRKVGTLTDAGARAYLRAQLDSHDAALVGEALAALGALFDVESIPVAIRMLKHPERAFRIHAAKFIGWSKDPRGLEPIGEAIDSLPVVDPNEDDNDYPGALGEAAFGYYETIT